MYKNWAFCPSAGVNTNISFDEIGLRNPETVSYKYYAVYRPIGYDGYGGMNHLFPSVFCNFDIVKNTRSFNLFARFSMNYVPLNSKEGWDYYERNLELKERYLQYGMGIGLRIKLKSKNSN